MADQFRERRTDVRQQVDGEARRLGKSLLRLARFAALGTLEADGSPAVSRVALATAPNGDVIFLISRLSGHFANLEGDARASLLVGEPGKGDPLAHPRMTLIGRAEPMTAPQARDRAKGRYLARHPKAALYADFAFWRFATEKAALNGGFGKAFALTREDLVSAPRPDLDEAEAGAVAHMNAGHAAALDHYAKLAGGQGEGWRLTGIDSEGLDLARGDATARLWFETPLASAADLRPALLGLAKR